MTPTAADLSELVDLAQDVRSLEILTLIAESAATSLRIYKACENSDLRNMFSPEHDALVKVVKKAAVKRGAIMLAAFQQFNLSLNC